MKLSQFRFDLPLNLIAQHPTKKREESRMMVVHRKTGEIESKQFRDIMEYFDDKDVFVVNNTKVFPARMYGRKEKTGAKIEVFLLRELNKTNKLWDVIVDPARKIRVGNKLYFGESDELVAEVLTIPPAVAVPFVSFGMEQMKSFARCWRSWEKRLCQNTSSVNLKKKTKNVTRLFMQNMKVLLLLLLQDYISARN